MTYDHAHFMYNKKQCIVRYHLFNERVWLYGIQKEKSGIHDYSKAKIYQAKL